MKRYGLASFMERAEGRKLTPEQIWDAAMRLERKRWRLMLSDDHIWQGDCPDPGRGWSARDPECRLCQQLISMESKP